MKVTIKGTSCYVEREDGEPKQFRATKWCPDAESALLHHVKKALNAKGYDLVKTLMAKDGHLVDDLQHYLRPRSGKKHNGKYNVAIYNTGWNVGGMETLWNKYGKCTFTVVKDFVKKD